MSLVLEIALTAGLIAVLGVLIYRALGATFRWLARHWLGIATLILSLLALVLVDWEEALGVIAVGGVLNTLRWLITPKDQGK